MFLKSIPTLERENTRLEIYGKGELLEELHDLVEKKGLEKQVYFGGYIENITLPSVYNGMDVFLLGSKHESFGVAAIEAMACELPVIATDTSGFQEVVENNRTGYLVPVGDSHAMAERMLELYHNPDLCITMGKAGRQRVERLYNWENNVNVMLDLYAEEKNRISNQIGRRI